VLGVAAIMTPLAALAGPARYSVRAGVPLTRSRVKGRSRGNKMKRFVSKTLQTSTLSRSALLIASRT